jgi:acylphosphatase
MATVHLLIKGKVQGVFYRATAKEKAEELGLNGWVKNTLEGDVEATVSGNEAALQQFITWCRQGPPKAQVDDMIITPKPDDGLSGFHIIR